MKNEPSIYSEEFEMSTTFMQKKEAVVRKWYIIDAAGKPLGKTAVAAADLLRGKNAPEFTPHVDCGDNVIIINADKVKFKSVSFLADRDLKGELIGMHAQRSKYKPHSATLSQEEIDKKLTGYFATHTVLTRSDMQSLCQFTHSMAARHIRRLKEEGSLQNIGIRTQPIYVPCPGHYGK